MPTNTQKNVNNSKQTVVVNVNTYTKKTRKKPSPPKQEVPIEQEQQVIRPTVQQALTPRRPQPYMPNVTQIHTNISNPPPYFEVPYTNTQQAISSMRENFQNELENLAHHLMRNATTQEDVARAKILVDQATQSFENEISHMDQGVQVTPHMGDFGVQVTPHMGDFGVQVTPHMGDAGVQAVPHMGDAGVQAVPHMGDAGVQVGNEQENNINNQLDNVFPNNPIIINQVPPIIQEPEENPLVVRRFRRRTNERYQPYQPPQLEPNQPPLLEPYQPPPLEPNQPPRVHPIHITRESYQDAYIEALELWGRYRNETREARRATIRRQMRAIGASVGIPDIFRHHMSTLVNRLQVLAEE